MGGGDQPAKAVEVAVELRANGQNEKATGSDVVSGTFSLGGLRSLRWRVSLN